MFTRHFPTLPVRRKTTKSHWRWQYFNCKSNRSVQFLPWRYGHDSWRWPIPSDRRPLAVPWYLAAWQFAPLATRTIPRLMVDLHNVFVKGTVRLKCVIDFAFMVPKICPVFLPLFAHVLLFRQFQTVPASFIPKAVIFVINILVHY